MSEGWICLYREIQGHWVWNDPMHLKAWIAILLGVNHASRKVAIGSSRVLTAERGESLRSCDQWARIFGPEWDRFKVRRFFQLLERDGMIRTKNERKTLRLTVVEYDSYQIERTKDARKPHQQRTNSAPTVHTNKNDLQGNNEEREGPSADQMDIEQGQSAIPAQAKLGILELMILCPRLTFLGDDKELETTLALQLFNSRHNEYVAAYENVCAMRSGPIYGNLVRAALGDSPAAMAGCSEFSEDDA